MKYINKKDIIIIIIICIFFIIYIYSSYSYNNFIISEYDLIPLDKKVKELKKLYKIKREIYNKIDNNKYEYYLDNNFNKILKLLKIEIEKIKNINKRYNKKLLILDNISNITIIKADYKKELSKIIDNGYKCIIKIELDNIYLLNNLNKLKLNNQQCKIEIENIQKDYNDKIELLNIKKKSNIKKKIKNNKCKLHISWEDKKICCII